MPYQLLVIQGRSASQAIKLANGVTTVGRQEDCQLRIRSSQVSRKHCQLFEKKGLLIVKDLGSSNGTFVNGKKVEDQRVLEPGDELTVGPVKLRIAKVEAVAAAAPAAKVSDTAVAEAVAVGEEVYEIELDDQEPTAHTIPTAAEAAPPPAPPTPAEPAAKDKPIEIGEDAVADFLLDLDIDENDKT